jgi:prepilin-type N-terminal cleavage/methylation domain-containing protein
MSINTRPLGFTLIELMIVVAILAIVAAIAVPAYNGYIRESRLGAMRMNLDTLRIAVEAFRLDSTAANYGNATFDTETKILNQYGWRPEGDEGNYVYIVIASSTTVPPTYSMLAKQKPGTGTLWVRGEKRTNGTFDWCDPYDGKGSTDSGCVP